MLKLLIVTQLIVLLIPFHSFHVWLSVQKNPWRPVEKLSKLSPPVTHPAPVEPIEPSVSDLPTPEQPEVDDSVCCVLK